MTKSIASIASAIVPVREGSLLLAYIIALQAVIYTYDGWTSVIYFSEEVKEPEKTIPPMTGMRLHTTPIRTFMNQFLLSRIN